MKVVALEPSDTSGRTVAQRRGDARWTQPLELLAVMAGFVLVLAAQWESWFRVHTQGQSFSGSLADILPQQSIPVTDVTPALTIPYYVGWFVVFGVSTMAVLSSPSVRRVCAPFALGLIGGQALVVFAIIHTRGIPASSALDLPHGVSVSRSPGAYLALAAIVVFVLAVLPAVISLMTRPTAADFRGSFARLAGRRAERSLLDGADDDFAPRPGQFIEVAAVPTIAPPVPVTPPEAPPVVAETDHSLYRRPIEAPTPL